MLEDFVLLYVFLAPLLIALAVLWEKRAAPGAENLQGVCVAHREPQNNINGLPMVGGVDVQGNPFGTTGF